MARQFINMDMDNTNYGYWWVDYINENGEPERITFENDSQANEFYHELISERDQLNS